MKKEDFKYELIICPHGINVENNEVFAIFKAFVAILPSKDNSRDNESILVEYSINNINIILDYLKGHLKKEIRFKLDVENNTAVISSKIQLDSIPLKDISVHSEKIELTIPQSNEQLKLTNSFELVTSDDDDKSEVQEISEDGYDKILKESRDFAKKESEMHSYYTEESFNLITFYNKILEEPILAERLGLVKTFHLPINKIFKQEIKSILYDTDDFYNKKDKKEEEKQTFELCSYKIDGKVKYYNGLAKKFLQTKGDEKAKDFKSIEVTFFDKYKKNLNDNAENDGIYVNVKYNKDGDKIIDPFKKHNIFGFNVLLKKEQKSTTQKSSIFHSLSLLKRSYFNNAGELIGKDISSGYLLPNTTIQTKSEDVEQNGKRIQVDTEYLPELFFAWKGENLALNRLVKSGTIEPEDSFDDTLTKFNNDKVLKDLIDENFKFTESYIKETNPSLEVGVDFTYKFYIRSVTPLNYYLETRKEWQLRNPQIDIPEQILLFEDLEKIDSLKQNLEFKEAYKFPKFKLDAPVIISRESYNNENTPYVDSKNSMVVNLLDNESCEKRYLYPARITWQRFKLLGFLKKENISEDNISQYVRRCMRLERRSLKNIRENQGLSKNINYLADPRACNVEIIPNDLFTAQYFSELINSGKQMEIYKIFNLQDKFPYFSDAKGVKIETINNGTSNNLLINGKTFLKKMPLGAYAIKIHSNHPDNKEVLEKNNEVLEKNGEPLNFAFVDKPNTPHFVNINLKTSRFHNNFNTSWRLEYELKTEGKDYTEKDQATKSIKYFEQTEVLKLQHEDLDNLISNFDKDIGAFYLLSEEYPVELFIAKEGSLDENLQTKSYPEKLKLKIKLARNLLVEKQEIFRLKLSEIDEIIVLAFEHKTEEDKSKFQLWHNGCSIEFDSEIDFDIYYDIEKEGFIISSDDFSFTTIENKIKTISECSLLSNLINPEISIRDIQVATKIELKNLGIVNGQEYFSQTYQKNHIRLYRAPKEIILKDEGHPFYRKKRIKLFASSAFQGYFPKEDSEKAIGKVGTQTLEFDILNNTTPEVPELDTDLLLYNHQQKSWRGNDEISKERSFLVRVTFNQTFMREGTQNKFAIILGRYDDASCSKLIQIDAKTDKEDFSVIGEDITRIISNDILVSNDIDKFLCFKEEKEGPNQRKELIKYFENPKNTAPENNLEKLLSPGEKNICIDQSYYKILVCQPYYNVNLKKWQIILSFKNPENDNPDKTVEAFFVRLIGFKIAYGQTKTSDEKVVVDYSGDCYSFADSEKSKTIISSFTKPEIIPVYSRKKFSLKRYNLTNQLEVVNENYRKEERKVYLVSKLKIRTKDNLFINDIIFKDYVTFQDTKSITFKDNNYREIIILEFEKHDNFNKKSKDFSKLPIKGLRLINYVQFKI